MLIYLLIYIFTDHLKKLFLGGGMTKWSSFASPCVLVLNGECIVSRFPCHNISSTVLCLVAQLYLTLWHQVPLSMRILQARILEWVAMPSSRGSSQPRDWTQVSRIAGRFFTIWATQEAQISLCYLLAWIFHDFLNQYLIPFWDIVVYEVELWNDVIEF